MRQHQAVLAWAGCAKEIMQFVEKISDGLVCELLYLCALDGMPIAELERIYALQAKDRKEKAAEIWKERQRFLQRIYGKNAEIEQQHVVELHQEIKQMIKNSEKKQRELESGMTEIRNLCKSWQERQNESGNSVFDGDKTLLKETEEKLREVEGKLATLQKEYDSLQEENRRGKEYATEEEKEKISAEGNKETSLQISFRGLFERMRRKSESKKFITDYLSNKEYSKEQKDYLLRCLESASPRLTIPMMERLRNLNKKSSICQRREG